MQTVVEAKSVIIKIWGSQKEKDTVYRLIRYHISSECDEGTLLHNNITGETVLLNRSEEAILKRLPAHYEASMKELVEHRFLVPMEFDERKSVLQIRKILNSVKKSKFIQSYTILPTTGCNARCFYCYESEFPHITMTRETADRVVNYILSHCDPEKIVLLRWFGGEPLVGLQRIDQICRELKKRKIEYKSSMISNAYLFTEELASRAAQEWKLDHIQITLDGTHDIYNKTKAYVKASDDPYLRVLDNIEYLLLQNVAVSVRLNLGFHNADDLRQLIDELADRFGKYKKFSIYVSVIVSGFGFEPVNYTINEKLSLNREQIDLEQYIKERGCFAEIKDTPSLRSRQCMADSDNAIIINPIGSIGKCEHHDYDYQIGNIDSDGFDEEMLSYWNETSEWPICAECSLFPSCVRLKHCDPSEMCFYESIEHKLNIYRNNIISHYNKWKKNRCN